MLSARSAKDSRAGIASPWMQAVTIDNNFELDPHICRNSHGWVKMVPTERKRDMTCHHPPKGERTQ